jgi:hypothetical protein
LQIKKYLLKGDITEARAAFFGRGSITVTHTNHFGRFRRDLIDEQGKIRRCDWPQNSRFGNCAHSEFPGDGIFFSQSQHRNLSLIIE